MSARLDLTGRRFERLLALDYSHSDDGGRALWLCRCDCGTEVAVRGKDLRRGLTGSCGCIRREQARKLKLTHGKRWTQLYTCWLNMSDRCNNPNNKRFKDYGGRGIKICDRWHSFANFLADILAAIGERPPGLTLDRIDNNGNYEPGNVRWATMKQQRANQRRMFDA